MGTPLKSLSVLLSPRLLSPLSSKTPVQLSTPVRPEENLKLKTPQRLGVNNYASRKLEFSKLSPNSKPTFETIKVKVTEYKVNEIDNLIDVIKSDIDVNTPNKRSITRNGLEDKKHLNILGMGRFGKVVRGLYKEKVVAVKVVKTTASLREGNALHLDHVNVVKTLDIVEKKGETFSLVVMEYMSNARQLQFLLEDTDINLDDKIISFAEQICEGIRYCHNNKILHLDIKPQNVLICGNVCKLCDFGNAVKLTDVKGFNHQGTITYTAPELLQGRYPTEKCDVYSLGILFWQLRSRVNPYHGVDNTETVIYKVVKCGFRPENSSPIDKYSKLYQKCWNANPEQRPSVSAMLEKLSKIVEF